jgi:RNA polymerase sigma-70 factor (ECF subfamily)
MKQSIFTDEQLGIRFKNGDAEAVTLIYERYKSGLFLFCLRLLSDHAAAEDVVQETFVKMIAERTHLKNPGALKSWMFIIARNEAFTQLHRKKGIRELNENDENIFQAEPPLADVETRERAVILEKMLDQLLPQYKEVLMLREYESMTYDEIAAVTGATVSAVKSRLFKARKALMTRLEPLQKASAL